MSIRTNRPQICLKRQFWFNRTIKLEFSALAKLFADSVDQAKHGGGATIPPHLQVRLEGTREKYDVCLERS